MITLDTIRRPVEADLVSFEAFVGERFTTSGGLLSEMLQYALAARGKGIRPLVVMLSAAMNAPAEHRPGALRTSLAALLVEMVHVASLVHDDVIDESNLRRGRASVNARWQSRKAILLGDYILARTMDIGLGSAQFDLVTHVCHSMATLCEGEMLQNELTDKRDVSRASYLEVIRKKTASLIGVSASAGAMSVGAPRERIALMQKFGEAIGMAFQIRDDMLDFMPAADTGKPAGNDLREQKATLPLIAVLEQVSDERRKELMEQLAACREDERAAEYLQRVVENEGGLEKAGETMQEYLQRALRILSEYEPSPFRDALANLCVYVGGREK